jgi:hypothetical protein
MMFGKGMALILLILVLCSVGVLVWSFVSTGRAVKKFDRLDSKVQEKLLLLEYYMAAVRNLSREDLIRLSELPDTKIQRFNMIHDYGERIQTIREKITGKRA